MIIQNKTLGDIVTSDFRTSKVFQKYDIDFCCGGKTDASEACRMAGIDPQVVEAELEAVMSDAGSEGSIDFNNMALPGLIDFILVEHHEYVREECMALLPLAVKVAQVHGHNHPELIEVAEVFRSIAIDMDLHQMKEERILFPYIMMKSESAGSCGAEPESCFGDIRNPISAMEDDHDNVGQLLFRMKEITSNYMVPADACESYRVLYKRLEDFQDNTFRHVHLENNILFPKAVAMQSGK